MSLHRYFGTQPLYDEKTAQHINNTDVVVKSYRIGFQEKYCKYLNNERLNVKMLSIKCYSAENKY